MGKRFEHIISINLVVKTGSEDRPSKEEIKAALDKFLDSDPNLHGVEWVDTEEFDD